jgi:hypothetical protein
MRREHLRGATIGKLNDRRVSSINYPANDRRLPLTRLRSGWFECAIGARKRETKA